MFKKIILAFSLFAIPKHRKKKDCFQPASVLGIALQINW